MKQRKFLRLKSNFTEKLSKRKEQLMEISHKLETYRQEKEKKKKKKENEKKLEELAKLSKQVVALSTNRQAIGEKGLSSLRSSKRS